MLGQERGTCMGSELYFQTPSASAQRLLYYMISCGHYYTNSSYHIERNNYHNYMIFYICKGCLSIHSSQKTMIAHSGQVGFVNCHLPHEYHAISNTEFLWLHMDGADTKLFHEQVTHYHGNFVFDTPHAEEIREKINDILFCCRNQQLPNEPRLSHKLYGFLTTLLDGRNETTSHCNEQTPIASAIDFIQLHYAETIPLIDIANHVNMSQYHFARLFKKKSGYSPHEFIIITRMNHAKHLLKTTDFPVKVISQSVGYQNISTFTNAFTARVGMSPGQFRKYPI